MSSNLTLAKTATIDSAVSVSDVNTSLSQPVAQTTKLPYQANHQVELLHLQAEIEALLHQLKTLKQQRTSPEDEQLDTAGIQVLVAR